MPRIVTQDVGGIVTSGPVEQYRSMVTHGMSNMAPGSTSTPGMIEAGATQNAIQGVFPTEDMDLDLMPTQDVAFAADAMMSMGSDPMAMQGGDAIRMTSRPSSGLNVVSNAVPAQQNMLSNSGLAQSLAAENFNPGSSYHGYPTMLGASSPQPGVIPTGYTQPVFPDDVAASQQSAVKASLCQCRFSSPSNMSEAKCGIFGGLMYILRHVENQERARNWQSSHHSLDGMQQFFNKVTGCHYDDISGRHSSRGRDSQPRYNRSAKRRLSEDQDDSESEPTADDGPPQDRPNVKRQARNRPSRRQRQSRRGA